VFTPCFDADTFLVGSTRKSKWRCEFLSVRSEVISETKMKVFSFTGFSFLLFLFPVSLFLSSVSAFSPTGSIRHPVKFIIGSVFSFIFVSGYRGGLLVDHGKIGTWHERSKIGVSFCFMLGFLIFGMPWNVRILAYWEFWFYFICFALLASVIWLIVIFFFFFFLSYWIFQGREKRIWVVNSLK